MAAAPARRGRPGAGAAVAAGRHPPAGGTEMQTPPDESSPAAAAVSGHCLCGAVTITVAAGHDPSVGACHCRMCQRWSRRAVPVLHGRRRRGHRHRRGRQVPLVSLCRTGFLPRCGSHLWFNDIREDDEPESYELMPGLFDAARGWPLRSEVYADRAMASVPLAGDHRRKTRAEYEADNPFVPDDPA
ncbi:MAG: GFA family protein [Comamonadaceae bacterium]|nr:GFA family protein [Comamonadaceae bacterium]